VTSIEVTESPASEQTMIGWRCPVGNSRWSPECEGAGPVDRRETPDDLVPGGDVPAAYPQWVRERATIVGLPAVLR
jgi:hypothetical protein